VAPIVLDSFHVPLVDKHDDLTSLGLVNLLKQFFIFFVDKDFFEFREKDVCWLNEPVHLMLVEALLSESSGTSEAKLDSVAGELIWPERAMILVSFDEVFRQVHSGLMIKALPSAAI
jgi:hypothetical protein